MTDNDIFENEREHEETPASVSGIPDGTENADTVENAENAAETVSAQTGEEKPPVGHEESASDNASAPARVSWTDGEYPVQSGVGTRFNPYTGQPYTVKTKADSGKKRRLTDEEKAEKKARKKNGFLRRAASAAAYALIFGVIAGAIIAGMNHKLIDKMSDSPKRNGDTERTEDTDLNEETENGSGRKKTDKNDGKSEDDYVPTSEGRLQSAAEAMAEALKRAEIAQADQLTIPQIAIIMQPAMVSVTCKGTRTVSSFFGTQQYQATSAGSGIIVGENETELLIVTNNHVIADADEISVQFVDETSIPALVKGTDSVNDLAVIVVRLQDIPDETMDSIGYAELGDSDALVIGEGVVAIGNALGFGQSVTNGIVSALNRAVEDENENTAYLIQTNAAINPGNSGGALVNMRGQVIGINSSKYADEAVEGMGFAIPSNTALPILKDLMNRVTRTVIEDSEKSGYLGISAADISVSSQQAYGMPAGVYVSAVTKGLAADKAGIIKGDIITVFDGETVTSGNALVKLLTYYEAGETVKVTVQRYERGAYSPVELEVTLSARPKEEETEEKKEPSIWDYFYGDDNNGRNDGNA